jgi:cytochrome c556
MHSKLSKTAKTYAAIAAFAFSASFFAVWNADQVRAAAAADFKTFMTSTVGPAVQPLWDNGYKDNLTDTDWRDMQQGVARLQASMAAITSGGSVAAEQARAKTPMWQDWTKKMGEQVAAAKAAVDKKDQMGVATAGDNLVEICEGCHMAFDPSAR